MIKDVFFDKKFNEKDLRSLNLGNYLFVFYNNETKNVIDFIND